MHQLKGPGIKTTTPRKMKTTTAVSHRMALIQPFKAQLPNQKAQQLLGKW
jgi:hypothetical protein